MPDGAGHRVAWRWRRKAIGTTDCSRFCWHFTTTRRRSGLKKRAQRWIVIAAIQPGTALLNFASDAIRRFRIAWTVANLQQLSVRPEGGHDPSLRDGLARGPTVIGAHLPKRWAKAGAFWLLTPNFKLAHN